MNHAKYSRILLKNLLISSDSETIIFFIELYHNQRIFIILMCPIWAHFFLSRRARYLSQTSKTRYTCLTDRSRIEQFSPSNPLKKKQKNKSLRAFSCAILSSLIRRRYPYELSATHCRQSKAQRVGRYPSSSLRTRARQNQSQHRPFSFSSQLLH